MVRISQPSQFQSKVLCREVKFLSCFVFWCGGTFVTCQQEAKSKVPRILNLRIRPD